MTRLHVSGEGGNGVVALDSERLSANDTFISQYPNRDEDTFCESQSHVKSLTIVNRRTF